MEDAGAAVEFFDNVSPPFSIPVAGQCYNIYKMQNLIDIHNSRNMSISTD